MVRVMRLSPATLGTVVIGTCLVLGLLSFHLFKPPVIPSYDAIPPFETSLLRSFGWLVKRIPKAAKAVVHTHILTHNHTRHHTPRLLSLDLSLSLSLSPLSLDLSLSLLSLDLTHILTLTLTLTLTHILSLLHESKQGDTKNHSSDLVGKQRSTMPMDWNLDARVRAGEPRVGVSALARA